MIERVFEGRPGLAVATAVAVVVFLAYVIAVVAGRIAIRILRHLTTADQSPTDTTVFRPAVRIVRGATFLGVIAVLTFPALDLVGVDVVVGLTSTTLSSWLLGSGLRVALIAILTYLLVRIVSAVTTQLERTLTRDTSPDMVEHIKRARTISRLVKNGLTTALVTIAALMTLRELGLDIVPILTGAGIVGLAVGFGAQTLVKDLISGFFLMLENQVRVGDVAQINGTGGLVEAINLRTIVLRDAEGTVHVFPNGSIERLANLSKDFSYYVIDVGIAHKEDPDAVITVLRQVGTELVSDERYRPSILEPLEIMGVDAFTDAQITIKIRIKTLPLRQWEVGRELRRRILKAFGQHGIDLPTRTTNVYVTPAAGR
jgi:small-conductance mechanosensitive channel